MKLLAEVLEEELKKSKNLNNHLNIKKVDLMRICHFFTLILIFQIIEIISKFPLKIQI